MNMISDSEPTFNINSQLSACLSDSVRSIQIKTLYCTWYLILQSRLPEPDLVGYEPVAVLAVEVLDARKVLVHGRAVVPAVQEILSVAEIVNR